VAYQTIRKKISHLDKDRILHDAIQKALALVKDGSVLESVKKALGELK